MSHHTHRARLLPVHHLMTLLTHVLSISWGRGHRAKGEAEKVAMVTKAKQGSEREAEALCSLTTKQPDKTEKTSAKNIEQKPKAKRPIDTYDGFIYICIYYLRKAPK